MLEQRDDIDAAALQHAAVFETDLIRFQRGELFGDAAILAGKKARANAKGARAETKIETCRLQLRGVDLDLPPNLLALLHHLDFFARQQAELRAEIVGQAK